MMGGYELVLMLEVFNPCPYRCVHATIQITTERDTNTDTITIELSPDLYQRLHTEAQRRGTSVDAVAETLLTEHLPPPVISERDRVTEVLRAAGLLVEPSPEMRRLASQSTLTLEEARAILDRVGGQTLSEVIIEMRGPKL